MRESLRKKVPHVGEKFHFFDDDKTSPSRHFIVEVIRVLPWKTVRLKDLGKKIQEEQHKNPHLYAASTERVCIGKLVDVPIEPLCFIRTIDGGWFSIGFWSGRLDIDGSNFDAIISSIATAKGISKQEAAKDYNIASRLQDHVLAGVIQANYIS